MITNLRIKNFKAWGEQLWQDGLELAPVTLFLGANSAGKTSLLQPLLFLQQTFASPDRSLDLYLGGKKGDALDLGTYEQVIHDHKLQTDMGFGLQLADVARTHHTATASGSDWPLGTEIRAALDYEVTYGHASGSFHLKQLKLHHGDLKIAFTRSKRGAYQVEAPGYAAPTSSDGAPVPKREYKPGKSVILSDPARQIVNSGRFGTDDLSLAVVHAIEGIRYLGPLRERPQPTYLWGGQAPGEIGSRGEDAVPALLANLHTTKKSERGSMITEVSRWLKAMGVADELTIEQSGKSRYYEAMLTTAGRKANLVHVGFGVSQVLPMIVLALTAPEGSTIIAEQPEIHLHPNAQTALANLLVETARERKLQFLIETHSEHLFRRLQFLVADQQIAKQDCRLYFVDRDSSGEPHLDHLEMDDFGRIKNWPRHFFGDAMGETERHIEKVFERMDGGLSDGR